jgi:hypothetical protein
LQDKKIYAKRFSTDAYRNIVSRGLLTATKGINDISCYENVLASEQELLEQHSYFISELFKFGGGNEEEK